MFVFEKAASGNTEIYHLHAKLYQSNNYSIYLLHKGVVRMTANAASVLNM